MLTAFGLIVVAVLLALAAYFFGSGLSHTGR